MNKKEEEEQQQQPPPPREMLVIDRVYLQVVLQYLATRPYKEVRQKTPEGVIDMCDLLMTAQQAEVQQLTGDGDFPLQVGDADDLDDDDADPDGQR